MEDPTDETKLLENDSEYALKIEGKDNDNKTISFGAVLYEPEVNIKTEPDMIDLKLNQYFSENTKFSSIFKLVLSWSITNQYELQVMKY